MLQIIQTKHHVYSTNIKQIIYLKINIPQIYYLSRASRASWGEIKIQRLKALNKFGGIAAAAYKSYLIIFGLNIYYFYM